MTDEETMKKLSEIIRKLRDHSSYCWKSRTNIYKGRIPDTLYDFYEYLITNEYCLIMDLENRLRESTKSNKLELYIDGETKEGQKKGRLYLPPLEEEPDSVGMLSMRCHLRSKEISVRIEIHKLHEGRTCGIGYRFERGTHEFFHASLTNKRPDSEGGEHLPNSPKWLPTDVPRVPMRADDPVSLLVDVLIGFYGTKGYAILSSS